MSPAPIDPFPDFVNGSTVADGDQVDARFKALYDALDKTEQGINDDMIADSAAIDGAKLAANTVASAKLKRVPACSIYSDTGYRGWVAGQEAEVLMHQEGIDSDSMHAGTSAAVVIQTAGFYSVVGRFDTSALVAGTGQVQVQVQRDNGRVAAGYIPVGGQGVTVPYQDYLPAGVALRLYVVNNASVAIGLLTATLTVVRLSA